VTGPMIFTPEYYARMRENESGGWWNAGMRDVIESLLADAGLPATGVLLDVGCGSGQSMRWFLERHTGWRTAGVDVSWDGLRAARALGQAVERASALALPFPAASVDLVLSLDVIQHLPLQDGDRTALAEMRRVLRPGGWLCLRTNAQAFPRTRDDPEHDFHKYEPAELRAKLEGAGFRVARLSRINALLGFAEIPRELRATLRHGAGYHGILAARPRRRALDGLLRGWLRLEGRAVRRGWRLPLGRAIVALCRAEDRREAP
jgi:SAM-dependent methyltransferase